MKIVYVTSRFPHPPLKGNQVRAFNQIQELSKRHDLYLIAFSKSHVDDHSLQAVQQHCQKVEIVRTSKIVSLLSAAYDFFLSGKSLNETYFRNADLDRTVSKVIRTVDPDLLHCSMIRTAPCGFRLASADLIGPVQSIDFIDALSLNLERKTDRSPWWQRWLWRLEHKRVQQLEKDALEQFDLAFVTSDVDRYRLLALMDSGISADSVEQKTSTKPGDIRASEIDVIPNGVDVEKFGFGSIEGRSERGIVFTGNMSYRPNVVAVRHFVETIFPHIREACPEVQFQIIGAEPAQSVTRLGRTDGVDVLGFVDSMAEHLQGAALSVCPLKSGAGIQNKVLEAMATGTPVVASPLAMEGIQGTEAGTHYAEGDGPEAFADAVVGLLQNKERRAQMGRRARRFIEENYTWQVQTERMMERFETTVNQT